MDELLITTVIPTFRRPAMLRQAINSARGQSWPHVRVCVFDNASGDETEEVVAKISENDSRVYYHRHRDNIGAYNNFVFGVRAVQTPFFSLLSDDDVLLPDFYEKAIDAFREHPDAMFVAMPTLEVDDSGWVVGGTGLSSYERRYYRAGEGYDAMWKGSVPGIWTGFVFRSEVFEEIGFNDSAGPASDVAFIRHVVARYPGVVVPHLAGLLRVHPGSFSVAMNPLDKMDRSFWRAQAERIENDEHVSLPIRSEVRCLIEGMYVKGLKRTVLSSLIDGRVNFAMESVTKLRSLGYPFASGLLRSFVLCYKYIPLFSYFFEKIALRRRKKYEKQLDDINSKYESQRYQFKALLQC